MAWNNVQGSNTFSSYRSEWDEGSQSTERLSEYLFFLRGRGKTLLESYISTNENSENDDFHQLLLRVLATLAPLSTRLCSPSMVTFQPTPELKIQSRVSGRKSKISAKITLVFESDHEKFRKIQKNLLKYKKIRQIRKIGKITKKAEIQKKS